jgi:outer membrane immunogenic protein
MRKMVLAGFGAGALIAPALGADLVPIYQSPQPVPALLWTWTGLYGGANGGWIASTGPGDIANTGTDTGTHGLGTFLALNNIPQKVDLDIAGFVGGGQIGYNWQINPSWLVGIEADFDNEAGGSNSVTTGPVVKPFTPIATVFNRELESLGTARGRIGYVIAPDQLWYVTAGLAYGETKLGSTFTCGNCKPNPGNEGTTAVQTSQTSIGWTLGSGIEWKFLPGWSVKAEYLYINLGDLSNTITYTYPKHGSTLTSTGNERDNVVRIGINYRLF